MSEYENTSPEYCSSVGLSCRACVEHTATQLAQTCKGLRGKAVGQLFPQIYPAPACSPMHAHFVRAYQLASEEDTPRRGVQPETTYQEMAAVA